MNKPLKVIIVEDSRATALVLQNIINKSGAMEVVAIVDNGAEAVELCAKIKPDVVTMDINIPKMNGLEATVKIMETSPVPIVIISSLINPADQQISFNALKAGAVDVMPKPRDIMSEQNETARTNFAKHIEKMAYVPVVTRRRPKSSLGDVKRRITKDQASLSNYSIIAIGASTGGPVALLNIFSVFPKDFSLPIVVAQHISAGFTLGMLKWLKAHTELDMKIAKSGEELKPGTVYFADDNCHISVSSHNRVASSARQSNQGTCPSIDTLFSSVAEAYSREAIGVILTGMGKDGSNGLLLMKLDGGLTIAQDEASSTVFGMPKCAIELDAAKYVLPLDKIGLKLVQIANNQAGQFSYNG